MRLTEEELATVTAHLVKVLKRKRFSVKLNKYGKILFAEKFGIRCCPAILNSLEDGRHGFSYIQNITNSYSEKDLGSYYKPRTNKDNNKLFDKNDSIDKYSGNDVHIDMHNYERIIEEFVNDLNKDYRRIVTHKTTEELDVIGDAGKVVWSALRNAWIISPENYKVKGDICEILRKAVARKENIGIPLDKLTEKEIDDMEELWRDDKWVISTRKFFDEIQLRIHNDSTQHTSYYVGDKEAISDVLNYIEYWVRDHQDRIWPVKESLVKIKDTGTVFDGMTAEVESEDDNQVTVWLELNGHKIKNNFKKENIDTVEENTMEEEKKILKEDEDDEEEIGDGFEVVEFDDERALALTNYIENELEEDAVIEKAYPEDHYGYNSCVYRNLADDSEWLVVDEDEADRFAREDIESLIDDLGPIEAFGFDTVSFFLDDDYFDDMLREDMEYQVNEMDYDELEEELLSYGIIDEDDMVPVDDEYGDDEDEESESDEEPEMHFDEDFLDSKRDELVDRMVNQYDGGVAWFEDVFGKQEMNEYITNNPDCVDLDSLVDNILNNSGRGDWLSHYDGDEHDVSYEDEDGITQYLLAYRIN